MVTFTTERLVLREFQPTDWATFRALEAEPALYYYEPAAPTETDTQAYVERAQAEAQQTPRTHYRLALTRLSEAEVCGRVTLAQLNPAIREWEIGWAVHPRLWGQGFATEAARALLAFAFAELRAHRVVAFSHAENAASLRVMRRLGLQQEGLLRATRWWRDAWSNEVVFAILEQEWPL
ncbi:MAG: GNAT family N-acetyltransferase [Anaerolineae bacterium]|nr:GNAT family N-acetyltransferase [Anaerolineae bacterium]